MPNPNSRSFSLCRTSLALPWPFSVLLAACGCGDGDSDGNPGAITARPQQTFLKKVLLMAGTFCLLIGAACLGSRPAYAGLEFCNESEQDVFIAYVSHVERPHYESNGWYRVNKTQCRHVKKGDLIGDTHRYWIAVKNNAVVTHKGNSSKDRFCFNPNGHFKIQHIRWSDSDWDFKNMNTGAVARNCKQLGSGFRRVPWVWLSVKAGTFDDDDHCVITIKTNGRKDHYCD